MWLETRSGAMSDKSGSVTLIFYETKLTPRSIITEPFLNLLAAGATMSPYTHVEMALGDAAGSLGQMSNVCRIFNDDQGVELTSRTGRNPQANPHPKPRTHAQY